MTDPNESAYCGDEGDFEQYAGEVIEDPWEDDSQTDWPTSAEPLDIEDGEDD